MSRYKKPYLQPYRGKVTRLSCPACGDKNSFTIYLNGDTQEPIHPTVGICNHVSSCGYHYPPGQYFKDHPELRKDAVQSASNRPISYSSNPLFAPKPAVSPTEPPGLIPFSYVEKSAGYRSHFVRFLCEFMTEEQIREIGENYALGATRNNEVIFWQIDISGKVRTGKIMLYNPQTGKRIKHESGAINWVHNKLKYAKQLPDNFNLIQCFFGEHLMKIYPLKTVAIVESEKTAIIASIVFPDLIWLSCGNLNGLSVEKCRVLKGKNVILFPDLKVFDIWSKKAAEIQKECNCKIKMSNMLENLASEDDKKQGLDIADFLIDQIKANKSDYTPKPKFSKTLTGFINRNPAVQILIDSLSLEEINK